MRGRRDYIRQSASSHSDRLKIERWHRSLDASIRDAMRRPSKADLKRMLEEAAKNTAELEVDA